MERSQYINVHVLLEWGIIYGMHAHILHAYLAHISDLCTQAHRVRVCYSVDSIKRTVPFKVLLLKKTSKKSVKS